MPGIFRPGNRPPVQVTPRSAAAFGALSFPPEQFVTPAAGAAAGLIFLFGVTGAGSISINPELPAGQINHSLTGVVHTVTPTLPAGTLQVDTSHTGTVLTITPSLPAGTVNHSLTGVVLTVTPTLPAGELSEAAGGQDVTGVVLTTTPTLPAGTVNHTLTGVVLTTTPTLPAGQTTRYVIGVVLTTTPTLPAGALSIPVLGVVLTTTPTMPAGTVNHSVLGVVLTTTPTQPAGVVQAAQTVTAVVLTVSPSLPQGAITGIVVSTASAGLVFFWQSSPATFDPESITGCKGWYDFSDASTLYEDSLGSDLVDVDGDRIHYVDNKVTSGGYQDLSVIPAANAPLYRTDIINGLSVGQFDGVDDFLSNSVPADTSATIFIVAKKRSSPVALIFKPLFSIDGLRACLGTRTEWGPGYSWILGDSAPPDGAVDVGGTPTDTTVTVLRWASAASLDIAHNGNTGTTFDPHVGVTTGTAYFLGARDLLDLFGDYDIGEIIAYDSVLNATDYNTVGEYLATKWGTVWTNSGDVQGVVLTTTPTLPAGSITRTLTGVALSVTPTLPAGIASQGTQSITGVVLTITPSLPAGSVGQSTAQAGLMFFWSRPLNSIVGVVLSVTPTLPSGAVTAVGTSAQFGLIGFWTTSGISGTSLTGVVLTITPTLPTGFVRPAQVRAQGPLTVAPTLPAGFVSTGGSQIVTGIVLNISDPAANPDIFRDAYGGVTLPPGAVALGAAITGQVLTIVPSLPPGSIPGSGGGVSSAQAGLINFWTNVSTTIIGNPLTVFPSLPAGEVVPSITGVVLSVTPTLPAGTILTSSLGGVVLTITPVLPIGFVNAPQALSGKVLTVQVILPAGLVDHFDIGEIEIENILSHVVAVSKNNSHKARQSATRSHKVVGTVIQENF